MKPERSNLRPIKNLKIEDILLKGDDLINKRIMKLEGDGEEKMEDAEDGEPKKKKERKKDSGPSDDLSSESSKKMKKKKKTLKSVIGKVVKKDGKKGLIESQVR